MANENWTCPCGNVNYHKAGKCVKCGQPKGDTKKEEKKEEKKPAASRYDIEITYDSDDDGNTEFAVQATENTKDGAIPIPNVVVLVVHDGKRARIHTDDKGEGSYEHRVKGKRETFTFRLIGFQADKSVTILGPAFKMPRSGNGFDVFRKILRFNRDRKAS